MTGRKLKCRSRAATEQRRPQDEKRVQTCEQAAQKMMLVDIEDVHDERKNTLRS